MTKSITRVVSAVSVLSVVGLASATWAQVAARAGGAPAAFAPAPQAMPRAFVPPPAFRPSAGLTPAPQIISVPRGGSGLTRPLPLNFGGTRAQLPGPIGSFRRPTGTTFPAGTFQPIVNPLSGGTSSGFVVVARDGSDAFTRAVTGAGPTVVPNDSGFFGHIGTSGATLGFSSSGSNFSFDTSINNSSNVAVVNTGVWLTPGVHSISGQWGFCNPWGYWGYPHYAGYSYGLPIYSPTWPYPDPALSMYYTPPATQAQPTAPGQAQPAQPTVLEQAEALMGVERFSEAAAGYREHLSQHPDDAEAIRMLGVALILDRHPREAGEAMLSAYRMNPALAGSPVVLPHGLGNSDLAEVTNRAIEYARRAKTAQAWLTAAVLSQARDKMPVAREFAKNAKAKGLDAEVFARLMSAWNS